ncbi:hypothetical protein E4T44_02603 [Aureobasidium sp. EXF-8845]|nr:hypothetical protein E4T44_02603 [Aureobasidium sp. EXF-8845]KAI4855873.1 hypothetical protein E4T45_02678 [Aureobasidium sp. EXF-8846]
MMRSFLMIPAFVALAAGRALPQEIDLDMVIAAPDPTVVELVGATAQIVTFDTSSILGQATAAASSISIAVTNVFSGSAVPTGDIAKRAACDPQPTGVRSYAPVSGSDNASMFRVNPTFSSIAAAATAPAGYTNKFKNAGGSNNAYGYLGFRTLDSYDTDSCAAYCSSTLGCMAFNIYFERDPSVDPGTGSTGCDNPPSVTMIKCVLWGGPVGLDNAVNTGQMRNKFEVAIAGSNGYQNNSLTIPPGYVLKDVPMTKAINAPYDSQGYNTYMGATIFTQGAFNIQLCADYCTAQTAYNVKHPANDGTPPKICHFYNTYILYLNNASTPQGQYCSLYTEAWDAGTYATNTGQYRGSDHYFIDYSYTFGNATSPGPNPIPGDKNGAVYQARQDMKYYPSSLTATFLPFCTSLLGQSPTPTSTPAVLRKYPAGVLTSACNIIATVVAQSSLVTGTQSSSFSGSSPVLSTSSSVSSSGSSLTTSSPSTTSTSLSSSSSSSTSVSLTSSSTISASSSSTTADAYDVVTSYTLQPFCSNVLQYTTPIVTATMTVTVTGTTTQTDAVTETTSTTLLAISTESDLVAVTASTTTTTTVTAGTATSTTASAKTARKRDTIATPSALTLYADAAISSACSRVVPLPQTSTTTVQISHTTISTVDVSITTTTTAISTTLSTVTVLSSSTTTLVSTAISTFTPAPTSFALQGNGLSSFISYDQYLFAYKSTSYAYVPVGVQSDQRYRATVFTMTPEGYIVYTTAAGASLVLGTFTNHGTVFLAWQSLEDTKRYKYNPITCLPFVIDSPISCTVLGVPFYFDRVSSGVTGTYTQTPFAFIARR